MRARRRLLALAVTIGLVGAGLAAPASAATNTATSYTACADKKSGAIRLVVKGKKCKRSERRLRWNVQGPAGIAGPVGPQGPAGAQGPPGPAVLVRDGNGTLLGQLTALTPGPIGSVYVVFEGGAYSYVTWAPTGQDRRAPLGSPFYLNNTCTGTPYHMTLGTYPDVAAGGPARLLQLFADTSAEAFAFSGAPSTTLAVNTPAWVKDSAKACQGAPALPAGNKIHPLTPVPAPPYAVGTIRIG